MSKTKALVYCSLFTALIAVGAFIRCPSRCCPSRCNTCSPCWPGCCWGPRLGTISTVAYMLLGLAGLPIFTEGGGLWYVFKPSFGYIIGFCGGTFVTGLLAQRLKKPTVLGYLGANFCRAGGGLCGGHGLLLSHLQLCHRLPHRPVAPDPVLLHPGYPGDIALSILAAIVVKRLQPGAGADLRPAARKA